MKKFSFSALLIVSVFSFLAFAAKGGTQENGPLVEVLTNLQKEPVVFFEAEKKIASQLMGTEKKIQLTITLSGSKFRIESLAPEKALVVYDGQIISMVQFGDPKLGTETIVSRGKVGKKQRDQMILSELLVRGRLLRSFKIKKVKSEDNFETYEATPNLADLGVQSVTLKVDLKRRQLAGLSYSDEIGNQTSIEIKSQKALKSAKSNQFIYNAPKGTQINTF